MTAVLPGFRQFRFPAKLFTFTALGLAALAGMGWDDLLTRRGRENRHSVHLLSGLEPGRARRSLDRPARDSDRFSRGQQSPRTSVRSMLMEDSGR